MTKVLVPLADGSEEIEAVTIIDVLRRAGAAVTVASVMPTTQITASRGVKLVADCLIEECKSSEWSLIALPGGMPGAEFLAQNSTLNQLMKQQLEANRWLAAICAAPAVTLARNGLIGQRIATCHPAFQQELSDLSVTVKQTPITTDGKLVTSQGPGTAMKFAITLVECLFGEDKAKEVAAPMIILN